MLSLDEGYTANLYKYLVTTFPHSNLKQDKRSWLKFDKTGTLLSLTVLKNMIRDTGWYDLDESIYNTLTSTQNAYQAIILGEPKTTFVLSKKIVKIFLVLNQNYKVKVKEIDGCSQLTENNSRYFLILGGNAKYDITEYLNKWDIIPELGNSKSRSSDS